MRKLFSVACIVAVLFVGVGVFESGSLEKFADQASHAYEQAVQGASATAIAAPAPPRHKYAWYPSNQGPITAETTSYITTPCETLFGFWGAGTTTSWDTVSNTGSCSGDFACWNCAEDERQRVAARGGLRRHSTIEILD